MTDLMVTTPNGSFLYRASASGFVPDVVIRRDLKRGLVKFLARDFNGDGRADFLINVASGSYVYAGTSEGTLAPDVYIRKDLGLRARFF